MSQNRNPTPPDKDDNDEDKLARFRKELMRDADDLDDLRNEANEDMRFINVSGGQWEGFFEERFATRARPQFDLVSNFVNRFLGQWNQNRVGVDFKPDDANTSDDDADLINAIYRADFRQFSGKLATDNAVDEVATCGYGAFKLATRFEDDKDPENDLQRIEWRPIHNAFNAVFWDTAAQRIDKADARHCTVLTQYTKDSFEEEFPGKLPRSVFDPETLVNQFHSSSFFTGNTDRAEHIFVATRYDVKRKEEKFFIYDNFSTNEREVYNEEDHKKVEKQLKRAVTEKRMKFIRERTMVKQHVMKSVFSAVEFLEEERRIIGEHIPVIPIYGYRMYVDGREHYYGLVRKLKDAGRTFNMQMAQLSENAASAGQEIPIFDPDQMKGGIGNEWADKNNKPYLLARALRNKDGSIASLGPLSYSKPAQLDQSTAELLQIVPSFIQQNTDGPQQDTIDPRSSGKAINAIQKREDLNTQNVMDNIANAVVRSGEVYASMQEEVYSTPRILRTIGKDGTETETQLLKTVLDEKTGRPVVVNNLSGKRFRVYADASAQYETQREQTVEDLKGMLEAFAGTPAGAQYSDALIAVMLDNITGIGLDPIKELNHRIMLQRGLIKPKTDEDKALLAQFDAAAGQPDAQTKLIESAAQKEAAEARNLDANAAKNAATAEKTVAETRQVIAETEQTIQETDLVPVKTLAEIRSQTLKQAGQGL